MTHHNPYIAGILITQHLEDLRRPTRRHKREFAGVVQTARAS